MSDDKIPLVLYIICSKSNPDDKIICTEKSLQQCIDTLLRRGEVPDVKTLTRHQLINLFRSNHLSN